MGKYRRIRHARRPGGSEEAHIECTWDPRLLLKERSDVNEQVVQRCYQASTLVFIYLTIKLCPKSITKSGKLIRLSARFFSYDGYTDVLRTRVALQGQPSNTESSFPKNISLSLSLTHFSKASIAARDVKPRQCFSPASTVHSSGCTLPKEWQVGRRPPRRHRQISSRCWSPNRRW